MERGLVKGEANRDGQSNAIRCGDRTILILVTKLSRIAVFCIYIAKELLIKRAVPNSEQIKFAVSMTP